MSSRLDLIVFGASGFTGKSVVENLIRVCHNEAYRNLNWGIAGRSPQKLQNLLSEVQGPDIIKPDIPILIADASNEASLRALSAKTKVLMNCTGPFTTLGEAVVKACIATGTHYADITAELYFMLKMFRTYSKAAQEANVLIVTACGYGSVPATMGLVHLQKEFQGQLHSVECYSELSIPKRLYLPSCDNSLVHDGTWDSLVYEFKNYREYKKLKKETFPENMNEPEREKNKRSFFHKRNGKIWMPYPGPDGDVVDMTQRIMCERENQQQPFHFRTYTTLPAFYHFIFLIPAFFFYYYASFLKCFRALLRRFPAFFTLGYISRTGPSKRNMSETKFTFTLTGTGCWQTNSNEQDVEKDHQINRSLTVKVSGADPYTITAIAFIFCAITILKEEKEMPRGGVLTTGAAFYNTSLIEKLNSHGLLIQTTDQEIK